MIGTTRVEDTPSDIAREMTLTHLYNRNATWLQIDHAKLDRTVFDIYG